MIEQMSEFVGARRAEAVNVGNCLCGTPDYYAPWDVIEELPADDRLPLKKWVQTVHTAHTNGTNDAYGCRCYKQTHLDTWGGYDGLIWATTVDQLFISAVGHGAPREVIDVLLRHGAALPPDDAIQLTSVSLLETAERPGPLDLVAATHNLGHGDKLSATLLARALAAYIIFGDAACMFNMHRVAIDHEMAPGLYKPVRRTCSCVACDGLIRLLEMVGEGEQRETETRKIRGRVIVQAKIALKAVHLLENWHETGPVARRTIERALFPQMGPSARLRGQNHTASHLERPRSRPHEAVAV